MDRDFLLVPMRNDLSFFLRAHRFSYKKPDAEILCTLDGGQAMSIVNGIQQQPPIMFCNCARSALWCLVWAVLYRPTPVAAHRWRSALVHALGAKLASYVYPYPSALIWAPWKIEMKQGSSIVSNLDYYNVANAAHREELFSECCGWWVADGPELVADALRVALQTSALTLQDMDVRGRNWMLRDFGWSEIAEQTAQLYAWCRGHADRPKFLQT